jgi:hypothetical protein
VRAGVWGPSEWQNRPPTSLYWGANGAMTINRRFNQIPPSTFVSLSMAS